MDLVLIEPPTRPVLDLEEVKLWLRVDHSDDDALIERLTMAATQRFDGRDGVLGRCLAPQSWQLRMVRFHPIIVLPLPPTLEVTAVEYLDTQGAMQTLDPSDYRVTLGGWRAGRIEPATGKSWPQTMLSALDTVRITFRAGYEQPGSPPTLCVPEPITCAMQMLLADWYDNRGNVVVGASVAALPFATETLIAPYRASSFA